MLFDECVRRLRHGANKDILCDAMIGYNGSLRLDKLEPRNTGINDIAHN